MYLNWWVLGVSATSMLIGALIAIETAKPDEPAVAKVLFAIFGVAVSILPVIIASIALQK